MLIANKSNACEGVSLMLKYNPSSIPLLQMMMPGNQNPMGFPGNPMMPQPGNPMMQQPNNPMMQQPGNPMMQQPGQQGNVMMGGQGMMPGMMPGMMYPGQMNQVGLIKESC